jgi:hypothetical protein
VAYCRAYEIEKHWGKRAPPPEKLEFLSAKGGGIMTRPENWRHPDTNKPRDDSPAVSTPGALTAGRCRLLISMSDLSSPTKYHPSKFLFGREFQLETAFAGAYIYAAYKPSLPKYKHEPTVLKFHSAIATKSPNNLDNNRKPTWKYPTLK